MTGPDLLGFVVALLAGAASVATVASLWSQLGRPARFRRTLDLAASSLPLADPEEVGMLKWLRRRATAELVGYARVPVSKDLPWTTGLPILVTLAAGLLGWLWRIGQSDDDPQYTLQLVAVVVVSAVYGLLMERGFAQRWLRDAIVLICLEPATEFKLPLIKPMTSSPIAELHFGLWVCNVASVALFQSGAFLLGYFYDGWVWRLPPGANGFTTPFFGLALLVLGLAPTMLRWFLAGRRPPDPA